MFEHRERKGLIWRPENAKFVPFHHTVHFGPQYDNNGILVEQSNDISYVSNNSFLEGVLYLTV